MNQDVKAKWVAALRGGKYQQGQGYLRTKKDKFCCLGVLCDVIHPEKWEDFKIKTGEPVLYCQNGLVGTLGEEVSKEVDLTQSKQDVLMTMNDSHNASFDEIADFIEEKL